MGSAWARGRRERLVYLISVGMVVLGEVLGPGKGVWGCGYGGGGGGEGVGARVGETLGAMPPLRTRLALRICYGRRKIIFIF